MPAIPVPTIKWGKRRERSQMCEILTDDGRWVDKELPAQYSCVSDEDTGLAFLLDSENQFMAEDGHWHQIVCEKSQIPICLRKVSKFQDGGDDNKDLKDIGNQLFNLTFEHAQAQEFEKAKERDSSKRMQWIVSIICATMVLLGGMHYLWG